MTFEDWIDTLPEAKDAPPATIALIRVGWLGAKMDQLMDGMIVPLTDEELGRVGTESRA